MRWSSHTKSGVRIFRTTWRPSSTSALQVSIRREMCTVVSYVHTGVLRLRRRCSSTCTAQGSRAVISRFSLHPNDALDALTRVMRV